MNSQEDNTNKYIEKHCAPKDLKMIHPVAVIQTSYQEKFGTPRQSGVVSSAQGRIFLEPAYRHSEAFKSLEGFSHLWLIYGFHRQNWSGSLTVRPPRLGGNKRVGVFASRSPNRPNELGLSVVKVERCILNGKKAPYLEVSGVDLISGTPIYDLKPYLPYADAVQGAQGGYAEASPEPLQVRVEECEIRAFQELTPHQKEIITETLAQDPRPAIHVDSPKEDRIYGAWIAECHVRWKVLDSVCVILEIDQKKEDREHREHD